jgi:tRNA dimethylallyltransferase
MSAPRPILILGPTAGGKSDLAVELAERLERPAGQTSGGSGGSGGEVISADSMQVYRRMDAGTAKPPPALRARAPHHMIDIVEPTERFTVADWLERVEPLIAEVQSRGVRPIVVGGTNLYMKALLEGMFEGPESDPELRARLEARTSQDLHRRLSEIDPAAAQRIHPNDHKKLVRAVEVFELTGKPLSAWQTQWSAAPGSAKYRHDPILIGLEWPVEEVNRRINLRVKAMFFPDKAREQDGLDVWPGESLVAETQRLESLGLWGLQAREALGYKQVLEHLAGQITVDEAFERTKILTRRFAKTQRTWLRRFAGIKWLLAPGQSPSELAEAALRHISQVETRV